MSINQSTGGWQPFKNEDKPPVPGQDSRKMFTKEGLITILVIAVVLIVGGLVCSYFFGPHM